MRVAIRTDAAIHIGTGHVMRCLTLANNLKTHGASIHFICKNQIGNLADRIVSEGHSLHLIPSFNNYDEMSQNESNLPPHSSWLRGTWQQDLSDTCSVLNGLSFDWFIVDHYALDANWEIGIQSLTDKIFVIDDLADRFHYCDILLDQTFGRGVNDYLPLMKRECTILAGSKSALLRPEFSQMRRISLERRKNISFENILISMGGIDKDNFTSKALNELKKCCLPSSSKINVVMGSNSPSLPAVNELIKSMPWKTKIVVDSNMMANLMVDADLAIGAAGATSWERCCLGLPTLTMILAENQKAIVLNLSKKKAIFPVFIPEEINVYISLFLENLYQLKISSLAASSVTDGNGCKRVVDYMNMRD